MITRWLARFRPWRLESPNRYGQVRPRSGWPHSGVGGA